MTRLEALGVAAQFVDERVAARPVNARGYAEGPTITPAERWRLIEQVATFLMGDGDGESSES